MMSLPRPSEADHGVRALLEQFSREDDAPSTEVPSPSLQGTTDLITEYIKCDAPGADVSNLYYISFL